MLNSSTSSSGAAKFSLLSARVTSLNMFLDAKNARALSVVPTSYTWLIQDADRLAPLVMTGQTVTYEFAPGPATITVKVTFPNSEDVASSTVNVMVNDCVCSGKGECNAEGKCVCDASAAGNFCEDDLISGIATLGASAPDANFKFLYVPYARSLGDVMKTINFSPYMVCR
jgi:hypothetical protein